MENSVFAGMKKDQYLTMRDKSIPLDQAILFGTFDLHRKVENEPFVQTMVMKTITREAYTSYISQLYFIYKAMEEVDDTCVKDPVLEAVYFPTELNRSESLKADLKFFLGENWEKHLKPTPNTTQYVDRINYLKENRPSLLLSHHFIRYFGDLSGGQVLKYKMRKRFQLPENDVNGLQFYEFNNIEENNKFMKFYINRMNSLEISNTLYNEILEEARNVFQLNMDLFKGLENEYPKLCAQYVRGQHGDFQKMLDNSVMVFDKTWKASVVCLGFAIITTLVNSNLN